MSVLKELPRPLPVDETKNGARPLPIDQWDSLFAAVTTTLRLAADKPKLRAGMTEWPARETTVLECVRQLELLHDVLRDERQRFDESRRMVAALQEALALARVGLLRYRTDDDFDPGTVQVPAGDLFCGRVEKGLLRSG